MEHQPQPAPIFPVCPHCGADPCAIATAGLQLGENAQAVAMFCANALCRKMFNVQMLAMQQAPKIISPGMHRVMRG